MNIKERLMITNQKPTHISAIVMLYLLSVFFYTPVMARDVEPINRGKIAHTQKHSKLYYSKVNKVKGYYSCPKNFKRTSPTRKMNHAKACVNRKGENTYKKATYEGRFKYKCPKLTNMFTQGNNCMSCPKGAKLKRNKSGDGTGPYKCVSKK
jgi:hypothetical protein